MHSYDEKSESASICQGCLSINREFISLENYLNLFVYILRYNTTTSEAETIFTKSTKMCWECHKNIRNIHKFVSKIMYAQSIITDKSLKLEELDFNLSCLTHVTKNDYDMLICEQEDLREDIDIKDEIVDFIHNDDMYASDSQFSDDLSKNESNAMLEDDLIQNNVKCETIENGEETKIDIKRDEDLGEVEKNSIKQVGEEIITNNDTNKIITRKAINILKFEQESKKELELTKPKTNSRKGPKPKDSKKKKKPIQTHKFKLIQNTVDDKFDYKKYFTRVPIDIKECEQLLAKKRQNTKFWGPTYKYKCETCVKSFSISDRYEKHVKKYHHESLGKYICDICKCRFPTKRHVELHCEKHMCKLVCNFCTAEFPAEGAVGCMAHFQLNHEKIYECTKCLLRFGNSTSVFKHYRDMHESFKCDHCDKICKSRETIITHIKNRHIIPTCKICSKQFKFRDSLRNHMKFIHEREISENTYCVECDIQFDSITRLKTHLKYSVKHRTKFPQFPCQECGKVFKKSNIMKKHYNLIHLKRTDFHCKLCDKYFHGNFSLRQHNNYVHEKLEKPKNQICKYCGRGFYEKRIMINHERTHTGEKPFVCTYCGKSYTQKYVLDQHLKKNHAGEVKKK